MLHPDREFAVITIESLDKLALALAGFTWPLCSTFEHQGLLFFNDSTSADDAKEHAVVKNGQQVESITVDWCSEERAAKCIRRLLADKQEGLAFITPRIKPVEIHQCPPVSDTTARALVRGRLC